MRCSPTWLALAAALYGAAPAAAQTGWVEPEAEVAPLAARLDALAAAGEASPGTLTSLRHLLELSVSRARGARRAGSDPWLARAERYLAEVEAGGDPYATVARGEITLRAYASPLSTRLAGYAVYVPPDYDPARRYPLVLALHGGSSNGNLFVGLTLGARVPIARYRERWHSVFSPGVTPDCVIVAPDGFGNSMWRFMGERDALDVLEDAAQSYSIDPDRVVLYGHSNGGLGSFNIGMRHAWRFSAVVPLSGAPGWLHYLGGRFTANERRALEPLSGWPLIENARLTHLHAHHGQRDPGPMRPAYASALAEHVSARRLPFTLEWYATGHDVVLPVLRNGRLFDHELGRRRDPRPRDVRFVTGDYRAARQHWVEVTRIESYPALARVDAEARGDVVTVRTERVRALTLSLDEAPVSDGAITLRVDGSAAIRLPGPRGRVRLVRDPDGTWRRGRPGAEEKRLGLSGPIGDAYFAPLIHVYGTRDPEHEATLRDAAERGARGFFGTLIGLRQAVVTDRDLTDTMRRGAHLVLYGGPGDNAVIEAIADRLPVRVEEGAVIVRGERHEGRSLGVRFVYPSPLAPGRYVVVAAGTDAAAVLAGDRLPAFLPDWVVYDPRRLPDERPQVWSRARPVASGYFDDRWR